MEISTKVCGARAGFLLCAADEPEEKGSYRHVWVHKMFQKPLT